MPKLAVIDLGTNVIKVLVGTISLTGYTVLYEKKITSTISQHPLTVTNISLEDQKNIVDILVAVKKMLDTDDVKYIVANATSLLREAPNAAEIIEAIRLATDIEVRIISGIEEANLIYLGISTSFKLIEENGLILDIGGGSVECIIFNHERPLWEQSFGLGIRRVASQFAYSAPFTPAQVDALEDYYRTTLVTLFTEAKRYKPHKLIGSSGAFRTLLTLYKCHYACSSTETNSAKNISIEQFGKIYHIILTTPAHIWQKKVDIEPVFLKLIPLSAILVNLIIKTCNLQELVITDNALTTGLLVREWQHLQNENQLLWETIDVT